MSGMTNRRIKIRGLATAIVFIFLILVSHLSLRNAKADDLLNRSISISSSFASEIVNHRFDFDTQGPSNISSISFEYCTNTPVHDVACTPPAGLDVTGATIDSEVGITGFGISGATAAHHLIITRAAAIEAATTASFDFGNIQNPSTHDEIVYVRISVFDGPDATGTRVDRGSVVFVVEDRYDISAYVPPYMTFCVAVTVALDCSTLSGFLADFGEFSTTQATAVTTQFSVATNDPTGYNAFIGGQTMTSGVNIIPGLPAQAASFPGTSQFGLNLRANSSPSVGANPELGAVANGTPDSDYNTPNQFKFLDGDRLAYSPRSTGFNRYTVSYIVNVSDAQPPGIYATTLSFTSIASF